MNGITLLGKSNFNNSTDYHLARLKKLTNLINAFPAECKSVHMKLGK